MCLFVLEQGNRYIHYTLYLSLVFTARTGKTHFENTHIIVFKTKLKRNVKKIRVFSVLTYGQSLWTIVRFSEPRYLLCIQLYRSEYKQYIREISPMNK